MRRSRVGQNRAACRCCNSPTVFRHPSLPGLTRQSIVFARMALFLRGARVKPAHDDMRSRLDALTNRFSVARAPSAHIGVPLTGVAGEARLAFFRALA